MKFIILGCLLIYLHCYTDFQIHFLSKYGTINSFGEAKKGIIALDLSKFNLGDTIYLTFVNFRISFHQTLKYCFSNHISRDIPLNREVNAYSFDYGSMYVPENSYGSQSKIYIHYFDHYFKIEIPKYETKAYFLLMGYDFSGDSWEGMNVINTKFARYTPLIISCSFFGFILLLILILCLCKHRIKVCWDRANPNQNNIGINNDKESKDISYPSSDNQGKLNEQNANPEKEEIPIKDITDNNSQDNGSAPPQADYYPTSE